MKLIIVLILAVGVVASSGKSCKKPKQANRERRPEGRVIGGVEVIPHEIPPILYASNCVATLIHPLWALTASHCLDQGPITQLTAGEHNIYIDEGTEQTITVIQTFKHPNFNNPNPFSNDVALLKLERPFTLNSYVKLARLPPRDFEPFGQAQVAGWGTTEYDSTSSVLRKATVPLVLLQTCKNAYRFKNIVDETMLCSGTPGTGVCNGDSGGPMFCETREGKVLCGVVSWGIGCVTFEYPGVYARVSLFIDWIEETTGLQF